MTLTGKAEKDFFEWLIEKKCLIWIFGSTPKEKKDFGYSIYLQSIFGHLPQSAQFGLIQEWGGSVGYEIEAFSYGWQVDNRELLYHENGESDSRPEAQTKAVEKLNEIYNK